jgi:tetrapyrrole methylase family protein/MazG family protein
MTQSAASPAGPTGPNPTTTGTLEGLLRIVERLRDSEGCPWDRAQTHASLRQYLLEECYEALEAIDSRDNAALAEELGDLLVHIAFHADIARRASEWTAEDLIHRTATKLVKRHPHVFGEAEKIGTAADVVEQWEALKRAERGTKGIESSVPRSLPALAHAAALQRKAEAAGVRWRSEADELARPAVDRPAVDQQRLAELTATPDDEEKEAAAGDLLFDVVAALRAAGVDPETSLRSAAYRFRGRLRALEDSAGDVPVTDLPEAERARLWSETYPRPPASPRTPPRN